MDPIVILKNYDSTTNITIGDLSITILANSFVNLSSQYNYDEICGSIDLKKLINNSQLTINDGTSDLSSLNGIKWVTIQNVKDLEDNYYNKTEPFHNIGGEINNIVKVYNDITLDSTNHIVFANTDSGSYSIYLPPGIEGTNYKIINCGSSGNELTIVPDGVETIWNSTSITLIDGDILNIHYNNIEGWW